MTTDPDAAECTASPQIQNGSFSIDELPTRSRFSPLQSVYDSSQAADAFASRSDEGSSEAQRYAAVEESFGEYFKAEDVGCGDRRVDLLLDDPDNALHAGQSKDNNATSRLIDVQPCTLRKQLQNIWPLHHRQFNHAPLATLWEFLRAALYCGVNPEGVFLGPSANTIHAPRVWNNQQALRQEIKGHRAFKGKALPQACLEDVWQEAMGTFSSAQKSITLAAAISFCKQNGSPLLSLRLEPLRLELSHRFGRRFGSDRFLELKIPSFVSGDERSNVTEIVDWLSKDNHFFLGRLWKPFFLKHDVRRQKMRSERSPISMSPSDLSTKNAYFERVYLFAIDGDCFRPLNGLYPPVEEAIDPKERTKFGLHNLLEWAVGIGEPSNAQQLHSKLFSRLSLSLSRTFSTVTLDKDQIRHRDRDLGTNGVMNDGAGRMSIALADKITECLHLSRRPCAFQGRFGSAKGVWVVDFESIDDGFWIELFPSQVKFACDFLDPHHRTFEVRSAPSALKSAELNGQLILILEACAINRQLMRECISKRLRESLQESFKGLDDGLRNPYTLWQQLRKIGLSDRQFPSQGYVPFLGGLPDSKESAILFLASSGFEPTKMKLLGDMVKGLCTTMTDQLRINMKIPIPMSAYALMVPDFTGVLKEGEVHLSFSTQFQVPGFCGTFLKDRDVLVSRLPAHYPTDIQKVRVVYRSELAEHEDAIVFSTKGVKALAERLSGGDYDGDIAWVCFDGQIVENFENSTVDLSDVPDLFQTGFLRKSRKNFNDLILEHEGLEAACNEFIHHAFSSLLEPNLLGFCTVYKERLCYHQNRIDSNGALILSTLLSFLVDREKQGLVFTWDDWRRLLKECIKECPALEEPEYNKARYTVTAGKQRDEHIRDYLKFTIAEPVIAVALKSIGQSLQDRGNFDPDLTQSSRHIEELYAGDKGFRALEKGLNEDLESCYKKWQAKMAPRKQPDTNWSFRANLNDLYDTYAQINPSRSALQHKTVERWLRDDPDMDDAEINKWELLKASTLYRRWHNSSIKFVFWMAGRQLAYLKGKAVSRGRPADSAPAMMPPERWALLKPDGKRIKAHTSWPNENHGENTSELDEVLDMYDDGMLRG